MTKNFKIFLFALFGDNKNIIIFKEEIEFIKMLPELLERDSPYGKSTLKWNGDKIAELVRLRFGLFGKPKTLQELGNYYQLSKERVWQLEKKALRMLRHPKRRKLFAVYQQ